MLDSDRHYLTLHLAWRLLMGDYSPDSASASTDLRDECLHVSSLKIKPGRHTTIRPIVKQQGGSKGGGGRGWGRWTQ